ncbi:MAG: ribosome recycling factor [Cytophagales bacterium]|nr:ribosome recycling factor [Cytophagales bacterium]
MEEIDLILEDAQEQMDKALSHNQSELLKVRAGKAMPTMLDGLVVDYYGSSTPIAQVASITTPDARTIIVKPWEKTMLQEIERSIINSDLGLNPQNDGEIIRLSIPPLTEERRRDLVKQTKQINEQGKIRLRKIRHDAINETKKTKDSGASEDMIKDAESSIQDLVKKFSKKLDELLTKKEEEIMTV